MAPVPEHLDNTDAQALAPGWMSTSLLALKVTPVPEHFYSTYAHALYQTVRPGTYLL